VMRRADRALAGSGATSSGSGSDGGAGHLEAGSLVLDPGRHEARVADHRLDLTPTEYRLLEILARAGGDLVPHLRLARAGWPGDANPDLLWLKPHLARLRKKVSDAGGPSIVAIRAVGYRLELD
jgi:DNA-binding response OmpR family regulator